MEQSTNNEVIVPGSKGVKMGNEKVVEGEDNAFDFICPYMMLWDVKELGAIAGAATLAATQDDFDGKIGSSFTYNGNEYKVIESEDGGTRVIALKPYIFYKGNMAEWIDKL